MKKKMTKLEAFKAIANLAEIKKNTALKEFVAKEIEILQDKTANKKPTDTQLRNVELKKKIVKVMTDHKTLETLSTWIKLIDEPDITSSQKLNSLVKQLIDSNEVVRREVKRVAFFGTVGKKTVDELKEEAEKAKAPKEEAEKEAEPKEEPKAEPKKEAKKEVEKPAEAPKGTTGKAMVSKMIGNASN